MFKRHHRDGPPGVTSVAGLDSYAAAQGWQPRPSPAVAADLVAPVHALCRVMLGMGRADPHVYGGQSKPHTHYHDAWQFRAGDRDVTIANAWTPTARPKLPLGTFVEAPTAVCAVELPAPLPFSGIESRRFHPSSIVPEVATGVAELDDRFRVLAGAGRVGPAVFPPELVALLVSRDDRSFLTLGLSFVSVRLGAFRDVDEVTAAVEETLAIVRAIPTSVIPAVIDRSGDDLAQRIAKLESVEDAIALLQSLSDDDRSRLAASQSPLASFAWVRTPEEALDHFNSLDDSQRMAVLATVMRGEGET